MLDFIADNIWLIIGGIPFIGLIVYGTTYVIFYKLRENVRSHFK